MKVSVTQTAHSNSAEDELFIDIAEPDNVELIVSKNRRTLWVNVNDQCLLRIGHIKNLHYTFREAPKSGPA